MTPKKPMPRSLRRTQGAPTEKGDDNVLLRLGRNVRLAREAVPLTQGALAEACGHTQVSISKIERGINDTHVTTLVAIAKALKTTPGELLG